MLKKFNYCLILGTSLITLSGCGNTVESLVNKGSAIVNKVKAVGSAVNNTTTSLNAKVQAVKKSTVYDYKFTFGELFDTTLENTKWETDKDKNEVKVTGTLKEFLFSPVFKGDSDIEQEKQKLLNKYLLNDTTTYTIIFPFFEGTDSPMVNAGVFSEVNAHIISNGTEYEVNGQELVGILSEAYIAKKKHNN